MTQPFIVFDLDDTLYAERDYVRSGLHFVGQRIDADHGLSASGEAMWAGWQDGMSDPIGAFLEEHDLDPAIKAALVDTMRAHAPDIQLYEDAASLIEQMRAAARPFAILTDGRSVTQRAKIAALGLQDAIHVSVSEEVGMPKTEPERFARLEAAIGADAYLYVGDNPARDFIVPNARGWTSVLLEKRPGNIHDHPATLRDEQLPQHVIDDLRKLLDFHA